MLQQHHQIGFGVAIAFYTLAYIIIIDFDFELNYIINYNNAPGEMPLYVAQGLFKVLLAYY